MVEKPVISCKDAVAKIGEGMTVMVGGFMACGSPLGLLEALHKQGTKSLTLVCNDNAVYDAKSGKTTGVAPLVLAKQFSRIITSHIGLNQESQRQMVAGETDVQLVPQGTLAERIRAAGAGLGGFLTPTGVGTEVEEGKRKITVGDRVYLLELPLSGDIALIRAKKADRAGNLVFAKTARNFNPLMATACRLVIAEVEEIVEIGLIDPDQVHTPSIFVDFLVQSATKEAAS